MTEPDGEYGAVRQLTGVAPEQATALVAALAEVERRCMALAQSLEAAGVHEHAFGRLIDAAKVRDAYHDRLPKAKVNLAEAGGVAREFLTEFAAPAAVPAPREAGE